MLSNIESGKDRAREYPCPDNGRFFHIFRQGVLDNPIYCGKLAFGRRKNEKIPGTGNVFFADMEVFKG